MKDSELSAIAERFRAERDNLNSILAAIDAVLGPPPTQIALLIAPPPPPPPPPAPPPPTKRQPAPRPVRPLPVSRRSSQGEAKAADVVAYVTAAAGEERVMDDGPEAAP